MSDPFVHKLGAFLDGELDPQAQSELRAHLATCPTCRAELDELQRLSQLLQAAPQPEFLPARDFQAGLLLQLPRQVDRRAHNPLPWLAPVLVLAGWITIQAALSLSTLVSLAHEAGYLQGVAAWTSGGSQQMLWFTAVQAVLGSLLNLGSPSGLRLVNTLDLFGQNLAIALLFQVGVAALYWGAFSLVWHYKVKPLWAPGVSE